MDTRPASPTDRTGPPWAQVPRVLPAPKPGGRPAPDDRRELVHALLDVTRTGGPWRALPHVLPRWTTVSWSCRRCKDDATFDRLRDRLRGDLRQAKGQQRPPSAARRDRHAVPTTRNRGVRGCDAAQPVHGRTRPILVDTLGLLLAVVVHAADARDRDGAKRVVAALRGRFPRPKKVGADGIDPRVVDGVAGFRRWKPIPLAIVKRSAAAEGWEVWPPRWIVERTLAGRGRSRRLSKDHEATTSSSEAFRKRAMIHRRTRRLVKKPHET